jgi:hypothetical protein
VIIVEYTNGWGQTAWGVTWKGEPNVFRYMEETEFVQKPKIIFARHDLLAQRS